MKYTDIRGAEHELELSAFTTNELRIYEEQHRHGHLLRNLYPNEYEMAECWCDEDEEIDAESYADARLEREFAAVMNSGEQAREE